MYKNEYAFEIRKGESSKMLTKFPNRVPVIVEPRNSKIPQIDRRKFMVPRDLMFGQLFFVIRKRMHISPEQAIFLFSRGYVMNASSNANEIYEKNKDDDGFLYVIYDFENTFGSNSMLT